MKDLTIGNMMEMQKDLYKLHEDTWDPMEADYGRNFLLWMMEEVGEVISIIKKKGDVAIMENGEVRSAFIEEMSDVLMYYNDILLRYGFSPEDISEAYIKKHDKNMGRDYNAQYNKFLNNKETENN